MAMAFRISTSISVPETRERIFAIAAICHLRIRIPTIRAIWHVVAQSSYRLCERDHANGVRNEQFDIASDQSPMVSAIVEADIVMNAARKPLPGKGNNKGKKGVRRCQIT